MAERKVVQIAAADVAYMALCDDGTMWQLSGRDWDQLPPIPQPQGEAGERLPTEAQRIVGSNYVRAHARIAFEDPHFFAPAPSSDRPPPRVNPDAPELASFWNEPSPAEPVAAALDQRDSIERLRVQMDNTSDWRLHLDLKNAIAELEEYRAWRQGKLGVEELYSCRRELQAATAELATLRARIATLESEEVTEAMVKAGCQEASERECRTPCWTTTRAVITAALRARGR